MDFTRLLEPLDNGLKYVNNNKNILLFVLIALGIYLVHYNESVTNKAMELYSNDIFKLIIFVMITYISGSNPALGISLAIMILVSFQIITNKKLKRELQPENNLLEKFNNFSEINPSDTKYLSDEFLTNPLAKTRELSRPIDLKLVTPTDISLQMLNEGKLMLDDSEQMEKNLKSRYDYREKDIADITKKTGVNLIQSGLNRMQRADMGEYNKKIESIESIESISSNNLNNSKLVKFIGYDKVANNLNDYGIMATYNELLNNYKNLVAKAEIPNQLNENQINENIKKININQFELLERIYSVNKSSMSKEKQEQIQNQINLIKKLRTEGQDKTWQNQIINLINLID
jgi:hypothetical protein